MPNMTTDDVVGDYAGWSEEDAVADVESAVSEGGGDYTYFKPEEGRNVVRFVPPPKRSGRKAMYVCYQHYIELPGRPKVVFNCPVKMKTGDKCPACEKVAKLRATGNKVDRETASGFQAKLRVYAAVVDRAHPEKGVQVYGFGKTVLNGLKELRDDEDVGDFFRPGGDGFDIVIGRTGTTKNDTEYTVRPAVKNTPLGDMALIDMVPDLAALARVPSVEEITAKLKGDMDEVKRLRDAAKVQALPAPAKGAALPAGAQPPWDDAPTDDVTAAGY